VESGVGSDVPMTVVFDDGCQRRRVGPAALQKEEEGEWPLKSKKIHAMAAFTMREEEMQQRRQFDLAPASSGGLSWTKTF
jgi:hypothetical protein